MAPEMSSRTPRDPETLTAPAAGQPTDACAASDNSAHLAQKHASFITTQDVDGLRGREGSDPTFRVDATGRGSSATRSRPSRRRPAVLTPLGRRGWDADAVASHLLQRRYAIMRGLRHRTPWRGIEEETLKELYDEAVTTVAQLAASQQRRDWRTRAHLERAVIAAFRHQAQHHWRHFNAMKRRGDRDAVEFDADLHGATDEVLTRIFDVNPHDALVARDWLAQVDGDVRDFWRLLIDGASFRQAEEELGLTYAECKVHQRVGLEQFARFRTLQEEGKVCQLRASAIAAYLAGTADAPTAERAEAHLACCLACALVHDQKASAVSRGLFHLLPVPLLARTFGRLRDLVGDRAAEATAGGASVGGGALLLGNGAATAVLCAGALAATGGACVSGLGPFPTLFPSSHHERPARAHADVARHAPTRAPNTSTALTVPPVMTTAARPPAPAGSRAGAEPKARRSEFGSGAAKHRTAGAMTTAQAREFDPESQSTASTSSTATTASTATARSTSTSSPASTSSSAPTRATSASATKQSTAATTEFGGP